MTLISDSNCARGQSSCLLIFTLLQYWVIEFCFSLAVNVDISNDIMILNCINKGNLILAVITFIV